MKMLMAKLLRFCPRTFSLSICIASMTLAADSFSARAQEIAEAGKIEAALGASKALAGKNHYVAWVSLELKENEFTRYQYDRYPDIRRIKTNEGVAYAKRDKKSWVASNDWGQTGVAVAEEMARKWDFFASVAEVVWAESKSRDASQGATVWKLLKEDEKGDVQVFDVSKIAGTPAHRRRLSNLHFQPL